MHMAIKIKTVIILIGLLRIMFIIIMFNSVCLNIVIIIIGFYYWNIDTSDKAISIKLCWMGQLFFVTNLSAGHKKPPAAMQCPRNI